MSDTAIRVQGLSKRFRIGARQERYATLRDTLAGAMSRAIGRRRAGAQSDGDEANTVWAVRDVSFDVPRGEILGIIGPQRRGQEHAAQDALPDHDPTGRHRRDPRPRRLAAGGRHRLPSRADRRARTSSSTAPSSACGAAEIRAKFDEIVAFAEVERFIDTPVKRYSSGMYVRLAFAVAAHLEPEILLVDEVLAVGDAAFQRKCLGKMATWPARGARCCS